ncbi:hypothetical protein [Microbacterium sp. gxy059]|uniref:hypothetical protein n=1 Tax=Microbacterium sp. gxy059 TaxID=2957199 RepID=UPI003D984A3D
MTGAPPHDDAFPAVDSAPDGPDEPSEASDPHGEWWIDGPIFSTEHRGSSITSQRPGAKPGRFTGSMVARLAVTFVFWIGFAFLALPRLVDPIASPPTRDLTAHGWWWAIVILATLMMVLLGPTFGFQRRAMEQYGQLGFPMVVAALVIAAAFLIALLIHLRIDIDYIRSAPRPRDTRT